MLDTTPVERMKDVVRGQVPAYNAGIWPRGWQHWNNTKEALRQLRDEWLAAPDPAPEFDQPAGIVMPTGGKYFPSAYASLRVLRYVGCTLPVQLWYLGRRGEVDDRMRELCKPLGVEWVDADERVPAARMLNGWELKAHAVIHSPYRRVLLLDSDCYPVQDPTYLLDGTARFFRDLESKVLPEQAWRACGVEPRVETEWESGQFAVDKSRSWRALRLAQWMCDHSDFYFEHFWGDKEAFHLAFRHLRAPCWVSTKVDWATTAYIHYDQHGNQAFTHRCRDKFSLQPKRNFSVFTTTAQTFDVEQYNPRLQHEDIVHTALAYLREQVTPVTEMQERQRKWIGVRATWTKATALMIAMKSRGITNRKALQQVKDTRWSSCHGNAQHNQPPCQYRAYSEDRKFHYCSECGCGEREIARLSAVGSPAEDPRPDPEYDKLDYPELQCPINMPGFTNAD